MKNLGSFLLISILTISIVTVKLSDANFGKKGNYGVIDWDNFGYYLYLPATFIYDDLKLQNDLWVKEAQTKYDLSTSFYQAHRLHNGNRIIQYTSGMAFIYSPAFFIGHVIAKMSDYPADGFSKPYQLALLIQSFLLVFLGLFFLRKLSLQLYSERLTIFLLLIICLGTNYFQISSANISSPHVYLFAFYAILLYLTIKWHKSPKLIYSTLIGLFSALMILSRPNELLFLIIPLFWVGETFPNIKSKFTFLFKNKKHLIALLLPLVIFGLIQPLYWNYVSGEWIYDSYKNEDFKLLNPYLTEYLFSYKKGWLLYTPIMALGLLGLIPLLKKPNGKTVLIFIVCTIWILSSWDCWWYADSYSQRSIVQIYPIFIIPIGFLIQYVYLNLRGIFITTVTIAFILIGFNLFQTYQFAKYIIHPNSMTKAYYWNVFGVTDIYEPNRALLDIDRNINYLPDELLAKHKVAYYTAFERPTDEFFKVDSFYYKKEGSLILNSENSKSKSIKFAYNDIIDTTYGYVICRMRFKSDFGASENPFGIEVMNIDSYSGKGYGYKYRGVESISWFEKGSWSSMDIVVIPAFLRNQNDSVQVNLKLFGSQPVEIDNFSVEVLDPSISPKLEKFVFLNDYHTITKGSWSSPKKLVGEKQVEQIDTLNQYSSTFEIPVKELANKKNVSLSANVNLQNNYSNTYAIASINKGQENLYYKSYSLIKSQENWEQLKLEFDLPNIEDENSVLKVYLWNKSTAPTLIRDLSITIN